MTNLTKKWTNPDDEKPQHAQGKCCAYGCPMFGSISNATQKSDDWLCPAHARLSAGNWQEITRRLNLDLEAVDLVIKQRQAMNFKPIEMKSLLQRIEAKSRFDLLPTGDEVMSLRKWHTRTLQDLINRATDGLFDVAVTENNIPAKHPNEVMGLVENWMKKHDLLSLQD